MDRGQRIECAMMQRINRAAAVAERTALKKLLALALLAALSGHAAAEWTALGGNDELTFYADTATLTQGDATSTMWTLVGSKAERSQGTVKFSSVKTKFEFDCAGPRMRELETSFHAGPLADGAMVGSYKEPGRWEPVAEGSIKAGLAEIACAK
jgi:hypothetical protein